MSAVQRKLVHKQFNSPMGLYSQDNVKATLNRELKAFGADGIEVDDTISKPLNLANSAVLRAVEEEDQLNCGYKRVAWPPASEERIIREFTPQPHAQSPAPGYAPHPSGDNHPPATAVPAQGPIYNNIYNQPSGYQNPPYQNPIQQSSQTAPRYQSQPQQQQYKQPHYQAPRQQEQLPEQPIQYTQAQFNIHPQPHESVAQGPQNTAVPQQSYQQNTYQREQPQSHDPNHYQQLGHNDPGHGWKPISGPTPKQGTQLYTHPGGQQNYPSYQNEQASQPQNYGMTQQQQQHQPQYNQVGPQQSYQPPNQQYQNQPNQYQNHSQQNPDPHYHQQQQQQPSQWNQHQQQQPPQYQAGYPVPAPSQVNTSFAPQSNYLNNPQTQYQQQPNFGPSSQNYSVPQNQQQQPISQDQTDQFPTQALPQEYRGGSPGIITLRKEAPVSQKPSPVYTSQPAATSYQGGNNLRGDLKWPPPEYKEAAARENEERRKLALGPVCRPRRVNRDYTSFFAQHALNSTYPSYKVPPGTQHMLA